MGPAAQTQGSGVKVQRALRTQAHNKPKRGHSRLCRCSDSSHSIAVKPRGLHRAWCLPPATILCVHFTPTPGGELLAAGLPGAHVFKAFNTCGTSVMAAVEEMGYPVQM